LISIKKPANLVLSSYTVRVNLYCHVVHVYTERVQMTNVWTFK